MTAAPRTILVTGASGFVGRHLMTALAVAYPHAALLTPTFDVRDAADVEAAIRTAMPDVCIHLAAVSSVVMSKQEPTLAWQVNLHGTLNLAWALSRHVPECHLLYASTADAYGASFKDGVALGEDAPLAPLNIYAETKATADLALCGMAAQGLRVVRLRPFNHTGPGQAPEFVVAAFARQIARIEAGLQAPVLQVGNLHTWRDFLDVRDVCAGYVACVAKRHVLPLGTVLNLASGQTHRIGDVLTELATLAGVTIDIKVEDDWVRDTDIRMACGDGTRARVMLEWAPVIPWKQTLQDVLSDWRGRIGKEKA